MSVSDTNYQIVYRGETLQIFRPAGWVFFQRLKQYGGGYWLGRTYEDCFLIELDRPVSLREGIIHLLKVDKMEADFLTFDDDFTLT